MDKNKDMNKIIKLSCPDGESCDLINEDGIIPYSNSRIRIYITNPETGKKGYLKLPNYVKGSYYGFSNLVEDGFEKNCISYGEAIAKRIADAVGIPACDADFGFIYIDGLRIPVSISYSDLYEPTKVTSEEDIDEPTKVTSEEDIDEPTEFLLEAEDIIEMFKLEHELEAKYGILQGDFSDSEFYKGLVNTKIPLVLAAFSQYVKDKADFSEEDIKKVKQSIIDMIMFDCKFANVDRHDNNFGLGVINNGTRNVRFYPLFDNEGLLGLWVPEMYIEFLDGEIDPKLMVSRLDFGNNYRESASICETVRILFEQYPEEARTAYEKVKKFTRDDLERLLEEYEDLSSRNQLRRNYTLAVFDYLDRELSQIYEEAINTRKPDGVEPADEGNGGDSR